MPRSIERSISCCRVIFAGFFFFVADLSLSAAVSDAAAAGAAAAGAVAAGAVAAGAVAAGAVVVVPVAAGALWASAAPAGNIMKAAADAAATRLENFCMKHSILA